MNYEVGMAIPGDILHEMKKWGLKSRHRLVLVIISNSCFNSIHNSNFIIVIIESVDSIGRDDPNTPYYIMHYKNVNNSKTVHFYPSPSCSKYMAIQIIF